MSYDFLNNLNKWQIAYLNEIKGSKALRIYVKALERGKDELANRIHKKYQHLFPKSDLVMAFGMALMAQEAIKKQK